jgi:hypothetical protein
MEISMKEIGLMTRLMVLEYTFMLMERDTKAIGKMICSMEEEKKLGQTDLFMKVTICKEKSTALVSIAGMMDHVMRENGKRIKLKVLEHILGLMVENTKVNGLIITWKVLESTLGKMEEGMRVNIRTIKSTDMVFIHGQIQDNIKVGGTKVNSMA